MAPRAYRKGSLKLSLVSCRVALYPATTSVEKTHFHMSALLRASRGMRTGLMVRDAREGDPTGYGLR
jgi:DNA end-binding protein Ku